MSNQTCLYRVSVKALILNDSRDKFLITKEDTGIWEIPGGGLEWGRDPHKELSREIKEEMSLDTTWIADTPSYFLFAPSIFHKEFWVANVLYETKLKDLNFTSSPECREIAFVNKETIHGLNVCPQIKDLSEQFGRK